MRAIFSLVLSLGVFALAGQNTISGKVRNESGESLVSAVVYLLDTNIATTSNTSGSYVLDGIPDGSYVIKATYLGYTSFVDSIEIRSSQQLDITLKGSPYGLDEIEIRANALEENSPFSYTEIDKEELELREAAQDIPYLLDYNPSVVVTSDAGAGVGYTSMRVRGSDATRVNVTINGVPVNDSESHGVFWVNMPDFASSVDNIQLQRGVGPSTNGAAAFGATLAMNTNRTQQNPSIQLEGTYGSFNTQKLSFSANTGLINDRWNIEGRYSIIKSDGYVDRASSDLKSYYFSAARLGEKGSVRFNTFSGSERTYQSWWGVPEAKLEEDQEELREHYFNNLGAIYQTPMDSVNLFGSDRRYNYYTYDNQVDDYGQDHYQLIWIQDVSQSWNFNLTTHYTRGLGFFEEYRVDNAFSDYGLEVFNSDDEPVESSDLVRRRWLDNHFLGFIFNNEFQVNDRLNLLAGVSSNVYLGDHFGNVIFAEDAIIENPEFRYYESDATKWDNNGYVKLNWKPTESLVVFADMQVRNIEYSSMGTDNDLASIAIDTSYTFLNPKFGVSLIRNEQSSFYFSFARSEREPVRSDFIDAVGTDVPETEKLWDLEAGHRFKTDRYRLNTNVYFMHYTDQLVLTGDVNDVGAPVRTNVDRSYRLGLELDGAISLSGSLSAQGNLAVSQNKIKYFEEVILDYLNNDVQVNAFENSDIAFSPNIIAGGGLSYRKGPLSADLLGKFVGRQYLDNTMNTERSLDPYFYSDLVFSYSPVIQGIEGVTFKLLVNNIFNARYASNGYTYSYLFGDLITENFLYPQAGTNILLNASFVF